jgi:serine/threonine-protein phosphatase 2A regulatory subunit B''
MIKPLDNYHITLNDLKTSKQGDVIMSILSDVNGFWAYDNRESLHNSSDEDSEK